MPNISPYPQTHNCNTARQLLTCSFCGRSTEIHRAGAIALRDGLAARRPDEDDVVRRNDRQCRRHAGGELGVACESEILVDATAKLQCCSVHDHHGSRCHLIHRLAGKPSQNPIDGGTAAVAKPKRVRTLESSPQSWVRHAAFLAL